VTDWFKRTNKYIDSNMDNDDTSQVNKRKLNFVNLPNLNSIQSKGKAIDDMSNRRLRLNSKPTMDRFAARMELKQAEIAGDKNKINSNKKLTNPNRSTSSMSTSSSTTPRETTTTPQSTTSNMSTSKPESTPSRGKRAKSSPKKYSESNPRWTKDTSNNVKTGRQSRWTGTIDTQLQPVSSVYNKPNENKGIYFPDGQSTWVDYMVDIHSPLTYNYDEPDIFYTVNSFGEHNARFHVNLSNFSDRLLNLANGADTSSHLYIALHDIYNKISIDVFKDTRSNLPTIWTEANFYYYLYYVTQGIEQQSYLNSILAVDPKDGKVNKALLDLRNLINQASVITALSDLRTKLIGLNYPPELA